MKTSTSLISRSSTNLFNDAWTAIKREISKIMLSLLARYPVSAPAMQKKLVNALITSKSWDEAVFHCRNHVLKAVAEQDPNNCTFFATALARASLKLRTPLKDIETLKKAARLIAPDNRPFRSAYVDLLSAAGEIEDIVTEYCSGPLKTNRSSADLSILRRLLREDQLPLAREIYATAAKGVDGAPLQFLELIPLLFPEHQRQRWWDQLAQQIESHNCDRVDSRINFDYDLTRLGIAYALGDEEKAAKLAERLAPQLSSHPLRGPIQNIASADQKTPHKKKIFGIGLSKTGTTSLSHALEIMGFSAAHYTNPISHELLQVLDAKFFEALTDTPIAFCFESLYEMYPEAYFIYTIRPLDDWEASLQRHWHGVFGTSEFTHIRSVIKNADLCRHGKLYTEIHRKLYARYSSAREAYLSHDQQVKEFFANQPGSNFLELDIFSGDGFEALSSFLNVTPPASPFPWSNKSAKKLRPTLQRGLDGPST